MADETSIELSFNEAGGSAIEISFDGIEGTGLADEASIELSFDVAEGTVLAALPSVLFDVNECYLNGTQSVCVANGEVGEEEDSMSDRSACEEEVFPADDCGDPLLPDIDESAHRGIENCEDSQQSEKGMIPFLSIQNSHRSRVLPNPSGRVFVVSEATSRTGVVAARDAAKLGGEVILLDSSSNFASGTLETLRKAVPRGNFQCVACDFRDLESVRHAVKVIKSRYGKIYCLVSGAGTIPNNGIDVHDGKLQNHISHFLLMAEMIPLLEAQAKEAGDARILNHSSLGYLHAAKYFRENGGNLSGNGTKIMGADNFHRYLKPTLARSTLQSHTAFKSTHTRPGTPLLVLARFVRIKAKGTSTHRLAESNSTRLAYAGIY